MLEHYNQLLEMTRELSRLTAYANTQAFPTDGANCEGFVTTRNSVGFARKKAQTISFVERGFERLGLNHQTVGFSWCSYIVKSCSPWESFSWRRAGRLWFFAIFSSLLLGALTFTL